MTALHVAYLINLYPAGSHTFVRREIQALERLGVVVQRIALRGWQGQLADLQDRSERELTRYVLAGGAAGLAVALVMHMLRAPRSMWRAAKLAWCMAADSDRPWPIHLVYLAEACVVCRWAAQAKVTHLHAHFATNSAEVAMLANALGGPPYSFTAHGSDIMDRPAQIGLPLTVGNSVFAVAVCSFGRSQFYRWLPRSSWDRVQVVRCGLEHGYGRASPPATEQRRRLLCVGRLSKEKGQVLLVHATKLLAERDVDFEIVLAGDGPMRAELESLTTLLGLSKRIHFTGWLDAHGVEQQLREARALVVPSLSEGLPVVIIEAMATARPVVAPFLAGIPELIRPGRNGWLFPAGDTEALAAAIHACLSMPDAELLALAEHARDDVWDAHDIDVEAAKLAKLFVGAA